MGRELPQGTFHHSAHLQLPARGTSCTKGNAWGLWGGKYFQTSCSRMFGGGNVEFRLAHSYWAGPPFRNKDKPISGLGFRALGFTSDDSRRYVSVYVYKNTWNARRSLNREKSQPGLLSCIEGVSLDAPHDLVPQASEATCWGLNNN